MYKVSHLPQAKRDELLKYFCADLTATKAAELAGINRNTANKWFMNLRQIIAEIMARTPRLGGVIEIDQAFFGRKRRQRRKKRRTVMRGLKYGLMGEGSYPKPRKEDLIQVLGILKREPKKKGVKSTVYVHPIKKSDRRTVMPIIHLVVEGKAQIYTDSHSTLSAIKYSGYKHEVVNHSKKEFARKEVHTNNLESFWGYAKDRIKEFRGVSRDTLQLHIIESAFRWNNNKKILPVLKKLLIPD